MALSGVHDDELLARSAVRALLVEAELTPRPALREELGSIDRSTERAMLRATGGVNTHRGAIWGLGLLVAAASLQPASPAGELTHTAKLLAALRDRAAPRLPSPGSTVSARYGAAGARGEARAGTGRPDVLLAVMSTLPDTGVLYAAGPHGLREVQAGVQAGARAVRDRAVCGREAVPRCSPAGSSWRGCTRPSRDRAGT